jgi:exosortase/archaeosortase family protein
MSVFNGALALNALTAVDRPRTVPWGAHSLSRRVVAWAALSVLAAVTVQRASVDAVVQVALHPMSVVDQRMVHGWGVLLLCLGGLLLKRGPIRGALSDGLSLWTMALGLVWLGASFLLFPPAALLACVLGLFTLLVGRAAFWPSVLMGVYLVSVGFPVAVERWADAPVGMVTAAAAGSVLRAADFPLLLNGQFITFQDSAGNAIRVLINASCAGPATLGVFLALYALMALDAPLPLRTAAGLFALGFLGTWLQNVGRLIYLLLVGHHQGEPAMWVAHNDSGYLWFIGWYAIFGLAYLRFAAGRR